MEFKITLCNITYKTMYGVFYLVNYLWKNLNKFLACVKLFQKKVEKKK